MAVNIPTLSELFNDILSDLESELNITIPLFGKNFLRALAAVQAAKLKLYYLVIANVQKNIFVDTADPESIGGTLERFGRVKLGRSPFTAQPGSYDVTVTGTDGAMIDANTTYKSNDDSLNPDKLFVLDTDYTLVPGPDTITLRALEGGLDSQLNIGDTLTVTAPLANVDAEVTVTAEVITPLAAEDIEDYREDAIQAYQLEAQGGAATDYRLWSADAQGVLRVYPYAISAVAGWGVEVFVEATVADSTDGQGTPPASMLTDVADVIEFDPDVTKPLNERGRRPITVDPVNILPVTVLDVDIEITNYIGLTPQIETSIFNAIEDALRDIRPFVGAADILANKNDILNINNLIFIVQQAEPDSIFDSLTLDVDSIPTLSFTFIDGDIPNLNSITYV